MYNSMLKCNMLKFTKNLSLLIYHYLIIFILGIFISKPLNI